MGEGSWQELYERELNECGKYKLTRLKSCGYAKDDVSEDYIKKQQGKTIVYSHIDKGYFAYKLTKRGFATGVMERAVQEEEKYIAKVEKQIKSMKKKSGN